MLKISKLAILSVFTGAAFMVAPAAIAQDKPSAKPQQKTDKPAKTEKAPDALDELFKRAEDEVKKGEHCGPKPDKKQTPIA